jgi:hypothetical protein
LWTDVSQDRPSLRKIEWITLSTDRSARKRDSPIAALLLPRRHLAQDLSLARRQLVELRLLAAGVFGDQRLDDLRVDHGAALRDGPDGRHELLDVLNALLQR